MHDKPITAMTQTINGSHLATTSIDQTVKLYDPNTSSHYKIIQSNSVGNIFTSMDFSPHD